MTVGTILNLALWVITVVGYIIFNLYQKNVKLEETVEKQQILLENIKLISQESDKRLKEMDKRGIFASDDEVGSFFKTIQAIQEMLNEFTK
jgi:hypothetical protein